MPELSEQDLRETPSPVDGLPPVEAYADEPRAKLNGHAEPEKREPVAPIEWSTLNGEPPARIWWIQDWLGPWPTHVAGSGGAGKTKLWQTIGTALATGQDYLAPCAAGLRVLMWLCEDDRDEIWRTQHAINRHFGLTMAELNRLHVVSRRGLDNTLFALQLGVPIFTGVFEELRQQVNDLRADVMVLDNIAQIYGGNASDQHQVTKFVNATAGLVQGRLFCPVLLGHVSRGPNSEFSGSAAWENASRMRWYLGAKLPDQTSVEDDEKRQPDVVYLARRKINYGEKDWRRLKYRDGVFVPEGSDAPRFDAAYRSDLAETLVLKGFDKLKSAGIQATDGRTSADYLPKQLIAKQFNEGHTKRELTAAMDRLIARGILSRGVVGTYANRAPRFGLVRKSA
jgi:RecA-family ATPase